jgi:tRNA(Met) C34 N-acetyltransferase TmcA
MDINFYIRFEKKENSDEYTVIKYNVTTPNDEIETILEKQQNEFTDVFSKMLEKNNINFKKNIILEQLFNEQSLKEYQLDKEYLLLIIKIHQILLYPKKDFDIESVRSNNPYLFVHVEYDEESWSNFLKEISWIDLNPRRIKKFKDFYE